jgi:hypothetical protein
MATIAGCRGDTDERLIIERRRGCELAVRAMLDRREHAREIASFEELNRALADSLREATAGRERAIEDAQDFLRQLDAASEREGRLREELDALRMGLRSYPAPGCDVVVEDWDPRKKGYVRELVVERAPDGPRVMAVVRWSIARGIPDTVRIEADRLSPASPDGPMVSLSS